MEDFANYAVEIEPGRDAEVIHALRHVLLDGTHLHQYSRLLGTSVWVFQAIPGPSSRLRVPGVVNVEGTAEHVFYALPPMMEATEPGIENMTEAEIGAIAAPTPRTDVSAAFPLGAPGFSHGRPATQESMNEDGSWVKTLDLIGAPEAWRWNRGEGSIIAVIDSGFDPTRVAPGQLVGAWTNDQETPYADYDPNSHGTMVSLIATARPAYHGFSGVAPGAGLYVLRPRPTKKKIMGTADIMVATDHILGVAIENRMRIIVNNSWGLYGCKSLLLPCRVVHTRLLAAADQRSPREGNIFAVWAAGNNQLIDCPQPVRSWCMNSLAQSVTVGACNLSLERQPYSSIGGQCYSLTPVGVTPTQGVLPWGAAFADFGPLGAGTSASAPQISGALAILNTAYPHLSNAELRAALRAGAYPLGPDRDFNPGTGSGLLRIPEALMAAPSARRHKTYAYEQAFKARVSTVR